MNVVTIVLFLSLTWHTSAQVPHDLTPIINTTSGSIVGINLDHTAHAFLGIPYAEPPLGALRFHPPVPLTSWNGNKVFNATTFGRSCFQYHFKFPGSGSSEHGPLFIPKDQQSEDCLTLNIFIPNDITGRYKRTIKHEKQLPVFFWIHGGGFVEGSSILPAYNPLKFIKHTKDIIVVTAK